MHCFNLIANSFQNKVVVFSENKQQICSILIITSETKGSKPTKSFDYTISCIIPQVLFMHCPIPCYHEIQNPDGICFSETCSTEAQFWNFFVIFFQIRVLPSG